MILMKRRKFTNIIAFLADEEQMYKARTNRSALHADNDEKEMVGQCLPHYFSTEIENN